MSNTKSTIKDVVLAGCTGKRCPVMRMFWLIRLVSTDDEFDYYDTCNTISGNGQGCSRCKVQRFVKDMSDLRKPRGK